MISSTGADSLKLLQLCASQLEERIDRSFRRELIVESTRAGLNSR